MIESAVRQRFLSELPAKASVERWPHQMSLVGLFLSDDVCQLLIMCAILYPSGCNGASTDPRESKMSKKFAEQILDSIVDENGHCGERGLSLKQFNVLEQYLSAGEWVERGCWSGNYTTKHFSERLHEGNIGRYHVVLSEYWHFNLRCTVVSIDLRPQDELDAEAAEEERMRKLRDFSNSEWQLQPRKRADFDLTLVNDYEYEGTSYSYYDDGTRHIYTFRDADGNCYVWRTVNPLGLWEEDEDGYERWVEAEVGGMVSMKATVKEHSEYRGTKQTVLTRAKINGISKG